MAAKQPDGIKIYKGKNPVWRVGRRLGQGACGAVHVLEKIDGTATEWAIKLCSIPTKKTRKGNSPSEVNDRYLHYEHVVYRNQFQDIQGTHVPRVPLSSSPPAYGDAEGFRFLVLEKMDSPLAEIVPRLLRQATGKRETTVSFGPIAVRLLDCIQVIHERKHVVVDVKMENFMLSVGVGKGKSPLQKLASRIRILDLALVQPWASIGSHRANEGTSGVVGTAMYASLNIHQGETPSRRDDLEALGYLIAELIMKVASGNVSMELPWADAKSDEAIGEMKSAMLKEKNSELYKLLGSSNASSAWKKYMDEVRGYSFKKKPDYEYLSGLLSKIEVALPNVSARRNATTGTATMAKRKRSGKRSTRSTSHEDLESPKKIARENTDMDTDPIDLSFESISEGQPDYVATACRPSIESFVSNDDSFVTAEMDWEPIADENQQPSTEDDQKQAVGITIVVETGVHRGLAVNLVQGRCESVIIGNNPSADSCVESFSLSNDEEIDQSHVKLDLAISKRLLGVVVTDLKSSSGTYVGSERIRSGKDWKLFRGDAFRIGGSLLRVKALDPNKVASSSVPDSRTGKGGRKARHASNPKKNKVDSIVHSTGAGLKRKGIQLVVVDGPHKGETIDLEHDVVESVIIGSRPTGRSDARLELSQDKEVKASHVRIELVDNKKLKAVAVVDKSKGSTKINRNTVTKGRAFINDRIQIGQTTLQLRTLTS